MRGLGSAKLTIGYLVIANHSLDYGKNIFKRYYFHPLPTISRKAKNNLVTLEQVSLDNSKKAEHPCEYNTTQKFKKNAANFFG